MFYVLLIYSKHSVIVFERGGGGGGGGVIRCALALAHGDVSLHLLSSLKDFSWDCKFADNKFKATDLLYNLCYK